MLWSTSLPRLALLFVSLLDFCLADAVADLATKGRPNLDAQLASSTTCNKANLQVRKEWSALSATERKAYISAVHCLIASPSKLDATQYPGAKTRYDDFVVVHMKQTMSIHGTGSFLTWHRYFTWAYEQALRTECGYQGTQPYWDWGMWAADPETSPIFDGSDTSMSGNGEKIAHQGTFTAPAGNGGGCVLSGPFKNFTVNLGPVPGATQAQPAPPPNPRSDGFGYNPRCLRRDLSNQLTQRYTKTSDIVKLIQNAASVGPFQDRMQAGDGVHGAAHFTISGDPGSDFYVSPGDPAFWLLHSMIDRVWYIWQIQDLKTRMNQIAGGTSMFGGGRQQSLDDIVDLEVVGVNRKTYKIRDLTSVVDGPFCYVYE
ncbi:Di-copper centre-containing protein [Patellaria atrata CBS 101060]|uniref:Di-copper centre-containing protein n=1 Tax=Patellaria atrata CBS 101060 TaxID=1346257 RepID=A0A9P4SKK5_9PEZI|nr:Di-copper centre-containing protein [Patellaria atrata CBS 101060]